MCFSTSKYCKSRCTTSIITRLALALALLILFATYSFFAPSSAPRSHTTGQLGNIMASSNIAAVEQSNLATVKQSNGVAVQQSNIDAQEQSGPAEMEQSNIAALEQSNSATVAQSSIATVEAEQPELNIVTKLTVPISSDTVRVYPVVSIKDPGAVIVLLHIQKTGGKTFRYHLMNDTELGPCPRCIKHSIFPASCHCIRPQTPRSSYWLFAPFSAGTGWPCGVHADLTELKIEGCARRVLNIIEHREGKEGRYFYITIIREPITRYISEFRHVQRGATWKGARLLCKGRSPTAEELPPCYQSQTWRNVTLDEFVSCPYNLANNRQTRMLADLTLVDCYNRSAMPPAERNRIMLASAKDNLRSMVFFGLTEYQRPSQYMFERTFNLTFVRLFEQYNSSRSEDTPISHAQYKRILSLNSLDIELYKFAKELFLHRFKHFKELNPEDFTSADEYDAHPGKTKDGAITS